MEHELITTDPENVDERLRVIAEPVTEATWDDAVKAAHFMVDYWQREKARGLAATQFGISYQVIIVGQDMHDGRFLGHALVNPRIQSFCGLRSGMESCLSIPGLHRAIARSRDVLVEYRDPFDDDGWSQPLKRFRFTDGDAACLQHELDHLKGLLIIDHEEAKFSEDDVKERQREFERIRKLPCFSVS